MPKDDGKITLYWDKEFKQDAKAFAKDKGTSVSVLSKKLIEQEMKHAMEVTVTLPNDVVSIVQVQARNEEIPFSAALEKIVTHLIRNAK